MPVIKPPTLKPTRIGYTWGRTFFNSLNLLLTCVILGLILYLFIHINNIIKTIVSVSVKSIKENKDIQPLLVDLGTTTAIGVLKNDKVQTELNTVIQNATNPLKKSINDQISKTLNLPSLNPTKPSLNPALDPSPDTAV